ncbi:MAG: hypothetical protein JSR99_15970 [Proteobacteria bacterium]|nr:hypothetical protein [Pseudomonadota bacterium]
MTLRPSLSWLLLTLTAALVAMFLAARSFQKVESAIAAAVFALVLCATAIRTNAPAWRQDSAGSQRAIAARDALRANLFLIMLAFLWCGLAFYAVYLGTHVRWQHGWEYGSACILIGGIYAYFVKRLANPGDTLAHSSALDRMARMAGYQAVLIGIGLVWLIGAGKLVTHKGDWAANHLFLAGGFAIMFISVLLIKTNIALGERPLANSGS